jgi:hypothetical protein
MQKRKSLLKEVGDVTSILAILATNYKHGEKCHVCKVPLTKHKILWQFIYDFD